jgi:hypothetical protein
MPFSTLADPDDLPGARAAHDPVCAEIQARHDLLLGSEEAERLRLAVIIAGLVPLAIDEDDLVLRAVEHFSAQTMRNQGRAVAS